MTLSTDLQFISKTPLNLINKRNKKKKPSIFPEIVLLETDLQNQNCFTLATPVNLFT